MSPENTVLLTPFQRVEIIPWFLKCVTRHKQNVVDGEIKFRVSDIASWQYHWVIAQMGKPAKTEQIKDSHH